MVLAAIGFGILGPLARFASDVGFTAVSFAFWRATSSVTALMVFLAIGVVLRRVPSTPLRSISRLEWLQLAAMGGFVAGTTVSLRHSTPIPWMRYSPTRRPRTPTRKAAM